MVLMVSRRRLEEGDFDAWKKRFEAGAAARKAAGCRGVRRFHGIEDPHELVVIFDWDTIENARAYVGIKVNENPKLVAEREGGGGPNLANLFVVEMEPLDN
jgi:heme-degrading monooxygenase HmoA